MTAADGVVTRYAYDSVGQPHRVDPRGRAGRGTDHRLRLRPQRPPGQSDRCAGPQHTLRGTTRTATPWPPSMRSAAAPAYEYDANNRVAQHHRPARPHHPVPLRRRRQPHPGDRCPGAHHHHAATTLNGESPCSSSMPKAGPPRTATTQRQRRRSELRYAQRLIGAVDPAQLPAARRLGGRPAPSLYGYDQLNRADAHARRRGLPRATRSTTPWVTSSATRAYANRRSLDRL